MNRVTAHMLTAALIVATVAVAVLAQPWIGQASSALLIVLGVAIAGAAFGLLPALIAAFTAFLIYNFFLVEPSLTFTFTTRDDLAPLLSFSLTALLTGVLAGRLKDREQAAKAATRNLTNLLHGSQALQSAVSVEDVEVVAADLIAGHATYSGSHVALRRHPVDRTASETTLFPVAEARATSSGEPYIAALDALVGIARGRANLSLQVAEALAAKRSDALKVALLASVSHDIRTPLASIVTSASSLAEFGDSLAASARASLLATIVSESERLDRFTGNLLELSRLQFGPQIPGRILDPADVIIAAATRVGPRLLDRFTGRVPSGKFLVCADTQLFEAAIVNLLDNAVIHAPDGPIEIEAGEKAGCFRLTISDHGCGIPMEQRSHVFEKFHRLDPTRPGSGLGLAIAKGFVEAASGTVEIADRADGQPGVCVTVSLPLARELAVISDD